MSVAFSRLFKSAYRKEPISAFIFVFGTADALLGGFSERWTLLSLGVTLMIISLTVRWLQIKQAKKTVNRDIPRRYLNPSSLLIEPLPELKKRQKYYSN